MKARAPRAGFLGEAAFGFVVSLLAAAIAVTASYLLPDPIVIRLVIAGIGLTFVLRSISRSDEKTGRVVTLAVWLAAALAAWFSGASLPAYVVVHIAMVWLARSLFSYSTVIEAALDLGITFLAISLAVLAVVRTESVFLAAWSFVLVQALHVSIPGLVSRWAECKEAELPVGDPNRGFADAVRVADEALRRIAGRG